MTRPLTAALPLLALAATMALGGGCDADPASSADPNPAVNGGPSSSAAAPTGPIELKPIPAGTALKAGSYAMSLIHDESPLRAVVDVPKGYFSAGGWVIDDGHGTLVPDEFGDVLVFGEVDALDIDPCRTGTSVDPGQTVRDLAGALTARLRRTISKPKPVTLGGYQGLYLKASGEPDACDVSSQGIEGPDGDDLLELDMTGVVRLWILDVRGQRVVVMARTYPGHTAHPAELVGIATSVRFTHTSGGPES